MNNPITKHYLILKDKKAISNIAFTEEDADRLLDNLVERGGPGDYYMYILVKAKRNIIKAEEVEVKEQEPRIGEIGKFQGEQINIDVGEPEGIDFIPDENDEGAQPPLVDPDPPQRWFAAANERRR